MRSVTLLVLSIALAMACSSCAPDEPPAPLTADSIQLASPIEDAKDALRRHDLHFVGVHGVGNEVPAVQGHSELIRTYPVRYVEGVDGDSPRNVRSSALHYADVFNRYMLWQMRRNEN